MYISKVYKPMLIDRRVFFNVPVEKITWIVTKKFYFTFLTVLPFICIRNNTNKLIYLYIPREYYRILWRYNSVTGMKGRYLIVPYKNMSLKNLIFCLIKYNSILITNVHIIISNNILFK